MVELKNEQLSIVVSEKGAELQSIKDANGKEYLWQGDPAFWPRLIAQGERKITFALESSVETKKVYPYNFTLSVSYVLDNNKIGVIWHVHNTDTQEIHFQIGGHPAFNIPFQHSRHEGWREPVWPYPP